LQDRLDFVKQHPLPYTYQPPEIAWKELRKSKPEDFDASPETAVSEEKIKLIAEKLTTIPQRFDALPKIEQLLKKQKDFLRRKERLIGAGRIDGLWEFIARRKRCASQRAGFYSRHFQSSACSDL
jgi:2-oxoglutarate dehydrogenase E1 component